MRALMADYKQRIRRKHPRIYPQELLNSLFHHPCMRIEYVERELGVSHPTATKYLDTLAPAGFLNKQQIGRNKYYMDQRLVTLFVDGAA